ncbi:MULTISPECIES: hypothetical protein [Bacillus]|uniref:Uncharacterized protein n=1 Tax=Bacillus infantis TaxID=324767 RepID=A0A5D4SP33_9BACI|nr:MULTISPECIES: hypothetical protein [Bacillus]MCA1034930.1 hypothetical protein [Bacillus infantis]MDT0163237.1 hypothetical protein [Bacillus sp. AG4(2022)]RYI29694.1 hypothetical protein EVU96_12015 [Bacillus infantis]TYS65125.1 hypothetical protein FZD47_07210 [Bacillus infantis]
MKTIFRALTVLLALFILNEGEEALAAPDPAEVEEMKLQAPLHIVGKVEKDAFFQDLPNEKFLQIRKMTLLPSEVIKAPGSFDQDVALEVYYHYIPSWMADQFTGPAPMDIAKGDIIEIWLEEGKNGWEPVMSGSTVKHVQYRDEREEAVKEPLIHKIKRLAENVFRESSFLTALLFIILLLAITFLSRKVPAGKFK